MDMLVVLYMYVDKSLQVCNAEMYICIGCIHGRVGMYVHVGEYMCRKVHVYMYVYTD